MLKLPVLILKFWYFEAPLLLFKYFLNLNKSFFNAFSFPLMVKTFFKPWKNEYREGLVRFSIVMGVVFKSLFIAVDLILFSLLLLFEIVFFVGFLVFPAAILYLPFVRL